MSNYAWGLPKTVLVNGKSHAINANAQKIEYMLELYQNAEYTPDEKHLVCLRVFFKDFDDIPLDDYAAALMAAFEFIDGGKAKTEDSKLKHPELVRWDQDLPLIISTINTMVGCDIRNEPLHWWTFLGYFQNIPAESFFATIIDIRHKLKSGKLKDKAEREFYRKNKDIIDIRKQYTEEEKLIMEKWGIKTG